MKEGDLAVLPRRLTSQIAIGRVTGPYNPYSGKVLTKSPVLKAFRVMLIICSLIKEPNSLLEVFYRAL
jgi:hypothetical protein